MIAKIRTYPQLQKENEEAGHYERMVECDTVHRQQYKDSSKLKLLLYLNNKLIDTVETTEKIKIFFMENGKTIDRIDFKCN